MTHPDHADALRYHYLIGWLSADHEDALRLAEDLERVPLSPHALDIADSLRDAVARRRMPAGTRTERLVA
jgi:hypothetical protein